MQTSNYLTFLLVTTLFLSPLSLSAHKKGLIATVSLSISAIGIYSFYRWLRSEEPFKPTIDNLNTYTLKPTSQDVPAPPSILSNTFLSSNSDTISPMSIDQLVTTINKNKPPDQALISLVGTTKTVPSITYPLLAQKGITITPQDNTVFIFSRGYARTNTPGTNDNVLQNGGCVMAAYMPIQDNIIPKNPCITFDYPDRRRCFNFGQDTDVQCLRLIYDKTIQQNPHAHIILIGDCRGAKVILNFATQQPKNVKALILLSPFFSAQQLTEQVAHNYLSWLPGATTILHGFFKTWFPRYDTKADELFASRITHIPHHIPIFIAHRTHDTLVSTDQVVSFVDKLKAAGHSHIHLITTDDTTARHSRLTPVKAIQQEVNRFLCSYNLPHHPDLLTS